MLVVGAKIVTEEIENSAGANPYSITLSAEQTASSGTVTTVDFTSIPAGTKHITLMGEMVSTDGTEELMIQLGDSSGFETSGYVGQCLFHDSTTDTHSSHFFLNTSTVAAEEYDFIVNLYLMNASTNQWVIHAITMAQASLVFWSTGTKSLGGELTQVRVSSDGTPDDFDSGTVAMQFQ